MGRMKEYMMELAERKGVEFEEITNQDIENDLVRFAVGFMLGKVPDALKHFGITEEGIRDMIIARLPEDLLDPAKYTDVINAPVATPAAAPA
jgi:hypothetical protein